MRLAPKSKLLLLGLIFVFVLLAIIFTGSLNAGTDTTPPLLHLQAPSDFSSQSGTFNVDLSVSDDTTISTVTYYYASAPNTTPGTVLGTGTQVTGTTTSGTFSYAWNTTALGSGTFYVWAQATDGSGNVAQSPEYTYYVHNEAHTTPPTVTYTYPTTSSSTAYVSDVVRVVFSEELDPSTVSGGTVSLWQGGTSVTGTVNYQSKSITFTPSSYLSYATPYTLKISTGVKDIYGNALAQAYSLDFSTGGLPSSVPSQVRAVLARPLSSTSVGIRWDVMPNSDAEWYYVYRDTSQNGSFTTTVATVQGSGAGYLTGYYVDKNLDSSTTYWYKVAAANSLGVSTKSQNFSNTYTNQSGIQTTEYLNAAKTFPPVYPTGISLTPGDAQVTVNWSANPEANLQGYNVYRSAQSGGPYNKVNASLLTPGTVSYTDATVANDLQYYYRVTAVDNSNSEGPMSVEKMAEPKAAAFPNVPHTNYGPADNWCGDCHKTHIADGPHLVNTAAQQDTCYTCHDGTASRDNVKSEFSTQDTVSTHPVGTTVNCSDCHNPHMDWQQTGTPNILSVWRNGINFNTGNNICFNCHGQGSTLTGGDLETPWYSSSRMTKADAPADGIECSVCHQAHGSQTTGLKTQETGNLCLSCHDRSAGAGLDEYSKLLNQPDSLSHHDLLTADQQANGSSLECTNCHNSHNLNKTYNLVDPDNPGPDRANLWQGTGDPTPADPLSGTVNEYCLKCHSGSLPTTSQTASYAPAPSNGSHTLTNINDTYYTSALDFHGQKDGTSVNTDPAMGYGDANTVNYVLACTTCHDDKGSLNTYSLTTQISSQDRSLTQQGLLTYSWTYLSGSTPTVGADLRFFCASCHTSSFTQDSDHSGLTYPTNCLSCHKHGNGL